MLLNNEEHILPLVYDNIFGNDQDVTITIHSESVMYSWFGRHGKETQKTDALSNALSLTN